MNDHSDPLHIPIIPVYTVTGVGQRLKLLEDVWEYLFDRMDRAGESVSIESFRVKDGMIRLKKPLQVTAKKDACWSVSTIDLPIPIKGTGATPMDAMDDLVSTLMIIVIHHVQRYIEDDPIRIRFSEYIDLDKSCPEPEEEEEERGEVPRSKRLGEARGPPVSEEDRPLEYDVRREGFLAREPVHAVLLLNVLLRIIPETVRDALQPSLDVPAEVPVHVAVRGGDEHEFGAPVLVLLFHCRMRDDPVDPLGFLFQAERLLRAEPVADLQLLVICHLPIHSLTYRIVVLIERVLHPCDGGLVLRGVLLQLPFDLQI